MKGDERTRRCARCSRYVHRLVALTAPERDQLLALARAEPVEALPCRRTDGTVRTRGPPPFWVEPHDEPAAGPAPSRRASIAGLVGGLSVVALFVALLTAEDLYSPIEALVMAPRHVVPAPSLPAHEGLVREDLLRLLSKDGVQRCVDLAVFQSVAVPDLGRVALTFDVDETAHVEHVTIVPTAHVEADFAKCFVETLQGAHVPGVTMPARQSLTVTFDDAFPLDATRPAFELPGVEPNEAQRTFHDD